MPRRGLRVCTVPRCPNLTKGGYCAQHRREADQARGTAAQRGYGGRHRSRFRAGVLQRNPVCVLCKQRRATVADHWPLSRRQLVARSLDPDDPTHGRGLCKPCHDQSTAQRQPGGFNAR